MATCLVTGGAGFLGSHLCDELLSRGHRVICVDNLETGSLANIEHIRQPDFVHLNLDIIESYFVDEPVDFVYHLASPASPIDYLRLPLHTLKVGSHGTHHTLGLAKNHRARFLLASTSEIYGDPQIHPQTEDYWGHVNPIGPRGVYDEAKRYAEALTMAYHRQQGVDTSIVRIFNSILADEQVLYDDGFELRRETVSEAAQRMAIRQMATGYVPAHAGAAPSTVMPAFEHPAPGFSVPSFTDGGRIEAAEPLALIGHPTDERCFEVRTRYGRSIRVTGHHSIFVEGEGGEPEAKWVEDLEVGDRVAIARRIEVPERDRTDVNLLTVWWNQEHDPWDLMLEWEGLGELAWEKRFDLFGQIAAMKRYGSNRRNAVWRSIRRMRESNRVALAVLRYVCDVIPDGAVARTRQGQVSLPQRIELTDEVLWLLGLYVAEGCWRESNGNAFINISCEDAVLDRAEQVIRERFGLHVVRAPASEARSAALFVHSSLLLRVFEHLGLGAGPKRIPGWILGLPLARLKWFLEGYREGDGVHSGQRFDEQKMHHFVTTSTDLKDDLIVALARFGLVPSVRRYASRINARPGKTYPYWSLTVASVSPWSPLEWDCGVTQRLQSGVTGDLVWAAVKEIVEIEPTELVYDWSVPGNENFWAGTGVMAKNTFGPRMRPHDGRAIPTFLRQALQNRPLTVFGDGSQTRSFCFVADLIRGLIALAESGYHQPVNIGNPNEMTLLELAQTVIEATGAGSEIVYEALPTDDPQVRQPDISLAREVLGWEPEVALSEGLRRTIEGSGRDALIGAGGG